MVRRAVEELQDELETRAAGAAALAGAAAAAAPPCP